MNWFSEPPKYRYFATEQKARDFITVEANNLWWILEHRIVEL